MNNLICKRFFAAERIAVSRIVTPKYQAKKNHFKDAAAAAAHPHPDAYDICIKAKAIARSAGAETALSYALNQSPHIKSSSKPVLLNTILSALARENNRAKFWQVFDAKVATERGSWSPELVATVLNQIAKEIEIAGAGESKLVQDLFNKATDFYSQAIEVLKNPAHLHAHNAYLKCISRSKNVPYLLWFLNLVTKNKFSTIDLEFFGINPFLPVEDRHLKLFKLTDDFFKSRSVELDVQSLTSILNTLARSSDGSIQLAETIWEQFNGSAGILDKTCHLALLLVYRNDLSRIFNNRKLIRSQSWKGRKHNRILELLHPFGPFQSLPSSDPKILSVYFEICRNMRFNEKIEEYMKNFGAAVEASKDQRLLSLIAKKGN